MQLTLTAKTAYKPDLPFQEFPVLEDDLLILRRPLATDTDRLFSLYGDPEVKSVFGMNPFHDIREVKLMLSRWDRDYNTGNGIRWAITRKGEEELLGVMAFRKFYRERRCMEVGYSILPEYRRQGITRHALLMAADYAFGQMGLNTLEALAISDNLPSQQLLISAGFQQEDYLRHYHFFNGKFIDMCQFCLHRGE